MFLKRLLECGNKSLFFRDKTNHPGHLPGVIHIVMSNSRGLNPGKLRNIFRFYLRFPMSFHGLKSVEKGSAFTPEPAVCFSK